MECNKRLKDMILSITHNGYSYKNVILVVEKLKEEFGNNEELLIEKLEEYYG